MKRIANDDTDIVAANLTGTPGNDYYNGTTGDDTFVASGGQDIVREHYQAFTDDTLILWAGSDVSTLGFRRVAGDLIITNLSTGDTITVEEYYKYVTDVRNVEHIRDGSGPEISPLYIDSHITGTAGVDYLYGDTWGRTTDDVMRGLGGNDRLEGRYGNDVLDGGMGNDILLGGKGDDSYLASGGSDVVTERSAEGNDTLRLWAGSSLANLVFTTDGADLRINFSATGDSVRLTEYLWTTHSQVDHILLGDGSELAAGSVAYVQNGTGSNNTIFGVDAVGILHGEVNGFGGDDKLYGGNGKDIVDGGAGNDLMSGRNGDDTYMASAGRDWISEVSYSGSDTIQLWAGAGLTDLTLVVSGWNLVILNTLEGSLLTVNAFFDTALPTGYIEHIRTAGGDQIDFNALSYVVKGTASDDVVHDITVHGTGYDTLLGLDGNDTLEGGAGDDVLDGGKGTDRLLGGAGNDLYRASAGADTVHETGLGNDTVQLWAGTTLADLTFERFGDQMTIHQVAASRQITIDGFFGAGAPMGGIEHVLTGDGVAIDFSTVAFATLGTGSNDRLYGDAGAALQNDILSGLAGDDVLEGLLGDDTLDGGTGSDTASYHLSTVGVVVDLTQPGADTGQGRDAFVSIENLYGSNLADELTGDSDNNRLTGGGGNDTLNGSGGDDVLDGSGGADRMYGGAGEDLYYIGNLYDRIFELAGGGHDAVVSSVDYALSDNVEDLSIIGTAVAAIGNAVANHLDGNELDNLIDGGAGVDVLRGFGGNDTYFVDNAGDVVIEAADSGEDLVYATASTVLSDYVETLVLTGGANINATGNDLVNSLTGNDGNNRLDGAGGADLMWGGTGNDTYVVDFAGDKVFEVAGGGRDEVRASISYALGYQIEHLTLSGGESVNGTGNELDNRITGNGGHNRLDGGGGNDVLRGGVGNDGLIGRGGADRFVFEAAGGANGVDKVYDFVSGTDRLVFHGADYGFASGHRLGAGELTLGSAAADAGAQFVFDGGTNTLYWDGDGQGGAAAVAIAVLGGVTTLGAPDFIFI